MSLLPIVKHQCCELTPAEVEFAEQVAAHVVANHPQLKIDPLFESLVPTKIVDAPALHVDDLSGIQNTPANQAFYQERARLRAMDGDLLATALPPVERYEMYCQAMLGLGRVAWLTPNCHGRPLNVVEACFTDRSVRREIVQHVRRQGLRYIHPHIGSRAPWELALLIQQASHMPIEVIAPPPELTRWVNDKGEFTKLVHTMFGEDATPPTEVVWNVASAASSLQSIMASATRYVAIKLPSAAGGGGNLLIAKNELRDRTLTEIDELLHERLPQLKYSSGEELLVTLWADDLVASPSAQMWIPPHAQASPILEGLFMQVIDQRTGRFTGFGPARLPAKTKEQMTRQCLLIAHVFQRLGYVGRCSLDMLLVGESVEDSAMKFIECNGRWGGTSLPMTLMNRLFADWRKQPFGNRNVVVPGIERLPFAVLLDVLGKQLFRLSAKKGQLILFNPQRMRVQGEVSLIEFRDSWNSSVDSCQPLTEFMSNECEKYVARKESAHA